VRGELAGADVASAVHDHQSRATVHRAMRRYHLLLRTRVRSAAASSASSHRYNLNFSHSDHHSHQLSSQHHRSRERRRRRRRRHRLPSRTRGAAEPDEVAPQATHEPHADRHGRHIRRLLAAAQRDPSVTSRDLSRDLAVT